jgi:hypothetical protein
LPHHPEGMSAFLILYKLYTMFQGGVLAWRTATRCHVCDVQLTTISFIITINSSNIGSRLLLHFADRKKVWDW